MARRICNRGTDDLRPALHPHDAARAKSPLVVRTSSGIQFTVLLAARFVRLLLILLDAWLADERNVEAVRGCATREQIGETYRRLVGAREPLEPTAVYQLVHELRKEIAKAARNAGAEPPELVECLPGRGYRVGPSGLEAWLPEPPGSDPAPTERVDVGAETRTEPDAGPTGNRPATRERGRSAHSNGPPTTRTTTQQTGRTDMQTQRNDQNGLRLMIEASVAHRRKGSELESVEVGSDVWLLDLDTFASDPRLFDADAASVPAHRALRLEAVCVDGEASLLAVAPTEVDLRLNALPAPRVALLRVGDQLRLGDTVLHLTRFLSVEPGPPPAGFVGQRCPSCRTPFREDTEMIVHRCGAGLHLESEAREGEEPLQCALIGDCPNCNKPVSIGTGFSYVPEL